MSIEEDIRREATGLGIDRIGFTDAGDLGRDAGLDDWLARSRHGTMAWMARAPERR